MRALRRERDEQIVLARDSWRERERRHLILLGELDACFFADLERVLDYIGTVRKCFPDLRHVLEVQAFVVLHAIGRRIVLAESDAEQHVVRVVIFAPEEVRVVRRNDGKSELIRKLEHSAVQLGLSFSVVRLHFEVVILEGVGVP